MASRKQPAKASRLRNKLQRDKVGDLFGDIVDEAGEDWLRISFRRNWFSPPFTDDGEIDYQRASEELACELTGGVLSIRRHLENGDLGYATDIPIASKDELEQVLRMIRKVFVEGLKRDNEIRLAGLKACEERIAELQEHASHDVDRRSYIERRLHQRRGRRLLGRAWFRKDNRRSLPDRRCGRERRVA